MSSATASSLETVEVVLDAPASVDSWTISGGPETVGVAILEASSTDDTTWTLFVSGLLPGYTYSIECYVVGVLEDTIALVVGTGAPFIDYSAFPLPWPAKVLEALTFAFGKESQHMAGVPATHLLSNYTALDPYLYVKSTLGFPDAGSVRINGRTFQYTSRTPTAFNGVTGEFIYWNIPRGSRVVSVTRDIVPNTDAVGSDPGTEIL